MKVYVLMYNELYESGTIYGVFSSKEKAELIKHGHKLIAEIHEMETNTICIETTDSLLPSKYIHSNLMSPTLPEHKNFKVKNKYNNFEKIYKYKKV